MQGIKVPEHRFQVTVQRGLKLCSAIHRKPVFIQVVRSHLHKSRLVESCP